ncbi:MAG: hypothetical protein LBU81_05565 [Methanosarcinales archaeon]|jgi:hypothetical protein|nr:hypothetical protein [Methanosarcinales archaeon]
MKYIINPFISVGNLKFGTDRQSVNGYLNTKFKSVFEQTTDGVNIVNDHYDSEGLILGYFDKIFKLRYIILTDPCEVFFENKDLLEMNYRECLNFMKKYDKNVEEEEYVGFTSYKYGISIYAEDAAENPDCCIEAVTIGERGYFEK